MSSNPYEAWRKRVLPDQPFIRLSGEDLVALNDLRKDKSLRQDKAKFNQFTSELVNALGPEKAAVILDLMWPDDEEVEAIRKELVRLI